MTTANALAWGVLLVCVSSAWSLVGREIQEARSQLVKSLLDEAVYDKTVRPYSTTTDYVLVKANLYVRSVTNVDLKNHLYNVVITLRQEWNDPRLAFDDHEGKIPYLTLTGSDRLWIPDLFITNSLEESNFNIVKPNTFERIYPNGNVLSSSRIMVQVAQDRDTLKLPLRLASYGYTSCDIVFQWLENNPVQISKSLKEDPRFHLDLAETIHCNSTTNTGEYSCLLVRLGSSITNARHNREGARALERQDETLRALIDPDTYNKNVRPIGTNGTQIVVNAEMYITSIKDVDAKSEEVTVIGYVRQRWNDARLQYDDHEGQISTIQLNNPQDIWIPDLFFSNSLKDKIFDVTVPNSFTRILPNGDVFISYRVAVKIPCTTTEANVDGGKPENLRCTLQMESYGYSKKDIVYRWNPEKETQVGFTPNLVRNHYKLANVQSDASDISVGTNKYSFLQVILDLQKV